jgi:streptogramin lyase
MRMKSVVSLVCCVVVLGGCGISRTIAAAPSSTNTSQRTAQTRFAAVVNGLSAKIREFPLANPTVATEGPDGNVWVGTDQLARVTPSGSITKIDVGQGGPGALTSAFGKLWFIAGTFGSVFVARMDVASGKIDKFPLGTGHCGGGGITGAPDGNVWFTDSCGPSIIRVTQSGKMTAFPIPGGRQAHYIIVGPDRKLWFTIDDGGAFAKIDLSGNISIIPLGLAFLPRGLALGPDGNVYIYDTYHGLLFRVTPQDHFTSYVAGLPVARNVVITVGPDRRIWMLSTSGLLQTFDPVKHTMSNVISLPPGNGHAATGAGGIVSGSDGDVWLTAGNANYVGVYEL